jgi:hypothetical protein
MDSKPRRGSEWKTENREQGIENGHIYRFSIPGSVFRIFHFFRSKALDRGRRDAPHHSRICPLPDTTYLYVVSSRSPIGPRACRRLVEMPTSAPKPNS